MSVRINKLIAYRHHKSHFCIYFTKQRFYNTKSFNNQNPILKSTQQLKRSINKSRATDLTRTGGNFSIEASLRHKHEYSIFDTKPPLSNEEHDIFRDLVIQGYPL